jgi:hypothetical protein
MRHAAQDGHEVGELLDLLHDAKIPKKPRVTPRTSRLAPPGRQ